jgi:Uma2 family endonuclease
MTRVASKSAADSRGSRETPWSLDEVEHLVLEGVSWELYEHLLKVVADRPLRLTYDEGDLEIMSPLPEHEDAKIAIGNLVTALLEELDVPQRGLGSTTFRRRLKKKGLEPDECFYIQNQPRVAGKKRINLLKDPPPDLAIEIDITSRSIPRLPIYAALGVPEIWRYDGKKIQCLWLERGTYRASEYSRAIPRLRVGDLLRFVRIAEQKGDQTAALKGFRSWLRRQGWAK